MRRNAWAAAAALLAVAVAAGGVVAALGAKEQAQAVEPPQLSTVKVQRRELVAMISEAGILTYGAPSDRSPYSVINQARGTYTKLPAVGEVVSQGHVLYRVDDRPVVLLHGSTPAYRSLSLGMSGPDVAELNNDLVALGYATSSALRPSSSSFGSATATAVRKLQAAIGLHPDGMLPLGQAVFEPTVVRVTTVLAQLGGSTQAGETVLHATSTSRQVQVTLDASQQATMAVGDRVTITLPNNQTTPGVVSSVGAVAACPQGSGPGGSNFSSSAPATDTCSASGATPTITVEVTPSAPAATGTWDQAPVQVGITTATVPNALVVPVTALLAQAGGGYAVEAVSAGASHHLVPVSLGLFDDAQGLVQITSPGLAAGQQVVVPAT